MPFALILLVATAAAPLQARWTFCVAESGHEIWITAVFSAAEPRERLEALFGVELGARGVARPVVQCPEPHANKTDMVNAQITATEFHRKLGDAMHAAPPPQRAR